MKKKVQKLLGYLAMAGVLAACAHSLPARAQNEKQQQVAINIKRDGALFVADARCKQSELITKLTELAAKGPTAVLVRADAGAPFHRVATVMDACESAGIKQVTLATSK